MEILRVPKHSRNATVARLMLLQAHGGRIRAIVAIEGPMSGSSEDRDHDTVSQAEGWAIATAEQRRASVLIIEDRT
jgi:hypothetical protein